MGATKSGAYTFQQEQLAKTAKAFAHPARIAILQQLSKQQHCQCGELVHIVGLAQSTVSQHLKELKHAGLIRGSIDGSKACYCLDGENLEEILNFITRLNQAASLQKNNCC